MTRGTAWSRSQMALVGYIQNNFIEEGVFEKPLKDP